MTRAPRSASWRVANGAAIACSSVTMVMPLSGCMSISLVQVMSESTQHGRCVHGQPAFVIGGPEMDGLAVELRVAADMECVQVERGPHGLEAKARHVRIGHLPTQEVHQQRGDERAMDDQARVALD